MQSILLIVLLVVAIALVGVILLQHGKGAGMGASFGAGASGTVFGAPGSGNALTKATTILAIIFFGVALALAVIANDGSSVQEDIFDEAAKQAPAATEQPASDIPTGDTPTAAGSDIPTVTPEESPAEVKSEDEKEEKPKSGDGQ